jgi:hypothetical protein
MGMIRFAIAAVLVPVPETEAYCYNIVKNKIKTTAQLILVRDKFWTLDEVRYQRIMS